MTNIPPEDKWMVLKTKRFQHPYKVFNPMKPYNDNHTEFFERYEDAQRECDYRNVSQDTLGSSI